MSQDNKFGIIHLIDKMDLLNQIIRIKMEEIQIKNGMGYLKNSNM